MVRHTLHTFPDEPVTRNYKTKEKVVIDFIKNKFQNYNWIYDKIINGGCSRKRPDLLLDLEYQVIIIEIDENQHKNYDCSCENKRLMQISQDLGHKPIIFIRFNPDDYYNNGIKINSSWTFNNNGISIINKNKITEWNNRLDTLEKQINYWISPSNITDKTIQTIQLFFDQ